MHRAEAGALKHDAPSSPPRSVWHAARGPSPRAPRLTRQHPVAAAVEKAAVWFSQPRRSLAAVWRWFGSGGESRHEDNRERWNPRAVAPALGGSWIRHVIEMSSETTSNRSMTIR
jgi:hypothetical protein